MRIDWIKIVPPSRRRSCLSSPRQYTLAKLRISSVCVWKITRILDLPIQFGVDGVIFFLNHLDSGYFDYFPYFIVTFYTFITVDFFAIAFEQSLSYL